MIPNQDPILAQLIQLASHHTDVTALWLYGSREKGEHRPESDYDLGVLFSSYIRDPLERRLRPELLGLDWEKVFNLSEGMLSVVDIQIAPIPLAMNIISGQLLYCHDTAARLAIEGRIMSKAELDYLYHMKHFGA